MPESEVLPQFGLPPGFDSIVSTPAFVLVVAIPSRHHGLNPFNLLPHNTSTSPHCRFRILIPILVFLGVFVCDVNTIPFQLISNSYHRQDGTQARAEREPFHT